MSSGNSTKYLAYQTSRAQLNIIDVYSAYSLRLRMFWYRHQMLWPLSFILALSLDRSQAIEAPKSRTFRGKETAALVDHVNQFHAMLDKAYTLLHSNTHTGMRSNR